MVLFIETRVRLPTCEPVGCDRRSSVIQDYRGSCLDSLGLNKMFLTLQLFVCTVEFLVLK